MPVWAHNGRELFFMDEENRDLIAAAVITEPGFQVGEKETLFAVPPGYHTSQRVTLYDVASDDQRFLMARPYQPEGVSPFVLVTNFFEELKLLVPN